MFVDLLSVLLGVVTLLAGLRGTLSQISTVTCSSSYQWAFNSRDQSPCLIASYLQGACNNGDFTVDPLPPSTHYVGPTLLSADPCQCSSVVYSLVSACADCQNRTYISWSAWNTNCSGHVYDQLFPVNIPPATAVPDWAYLDVGSSDRYNPSLAQADLNKPESSATAAPTGTHSGSPTSVSKKKSSNAGAIAGGVVAGVVAIGLIVGLGVFFFLRHKKAHTAPSAAYNTVAPMSSSLGQHTSEYSTSPFNGPESPGMMQRPYDPSDPSTFPSAVPTPTIHTTTSTPSAGYYDQAYGVQSPPPVRGAYSGVPEL